MVLRQSKRPTEQGTQNQPSIYGDVTWEGGTTPKGWVLGNGAETTSIAMAEGLLDSPPHTHTKINASI